MGAETFKVGTQSKIQPPYYSSVTELHNSKAQSVQEQPPFIPWCCCVGYWCSLAAWSVLYFTCKGTPANRLFSLHMVPQQSSSGFSMLKWFQCVGWLLLRMHWLSFYAPITLAPSECAVLVFLQLSVPFMCWLAPASFVRWYRVKWIVVVRLASFILHFAARAFYLPTNAAPTQQAACKDETKITSPAGVSEPGPCISSDDECNFTKGANQINQVSSHRRQQSTWYMCTMWQLLAPVRLPRHLLVVDFILVAIDAVLHLSAGGLHASVFINTGLFNLLYGVALPVLLASIPGVAADTYRDSVYMSAARAARGFLGLMKKKVHDLEGYMASSWATLVSWSSTTLHTTPPAPPNGAGDSTSLSSAASASSAACSFPAAHASSMAASQEDGCTPSSSVDPNVSHAPASKYSDCRIQSALQDAMVGSATFERSASSSSSSSSNNLGKQPMWSFVGDHSQVASGSSSFQLTTGYQDADIHCACSSSGRFLSGDAGIHAARSSSGRFICGDACMPPASESEHDASALCLGKARVDASTGLSLLEQSKIKMVERTDTQYAASAELGKGGPLEMLHEPVSSELDEHMMGYGNTDMCYDDLADDSTCAALPLELQQLMEKWQALPAMEVEPLYTSCVKRTTLAVKVGHSMNGEKVSDTLGDLEHEDTFIQVAAELSSNVISALQSSLDTDSLYLSTVCVRGCIQLMVHANIPLSSLSKVAAYGGWRGVMDTHMLMEHMQQALCKGLGSSKKLGPVVMSANGSTAVYQQATEGSSTAEVRAEVVPQPVSCTFALQAVHPMCVSSNQTCSLEVHLGVQGHGMGTSFMARAVVLNQGVVVRDCNLKLSMHESGRFCFGWLEVPPVQFGAVELWILGHSAQEAGKVYAVALLPILSSSGARELQNFFSTYPHRKKGKGATGSSHSSGSGVSKAKLAGGELESEEWHCFGELVHDLALLLMHACGRQPGVESATRHLHLLTAHHVAALLEKLLSWLLSQGLLLATRDCLYTCYKFQSLQKLLCQAGTDLVQVVEAAMVATTHGMQVGMEKGLDKSSLHPGRSADENVPSFTRVRRRLYACCSWRTAALSMELSVCILRYIQLFSPSTMHPTTHSPSKLLLWKVVAMIVQTSMFLAMHGTRTGMGHWKQWRCWLMLGLEAVFSWIVLKHLFQPRCEFQGVMNWFIPLTVSWAPRALHAFLFVLVHVPRFGQLALLAILTKVLLGLHAATMLC